jgi:membrane protein required for beta-lactamase induction
LRMFLQGSFWNNKQKKFFWTTSRVCTHVEVISRTKFSNLIKETLNRILFGVFMWLDYIFLLLWLVSSLGPGISPVCFWLLVALFLFCAWILGISFVFRYLL